MVFAWYFARSKQPTRPLPQTECIISTNNLKINNVATMTTKRKSQYSERGNGRLYKRGKDGGEYPAGDSHSGNYYLEFRVNGKRTRQRLTDPQGEPIKDLAEA